MPIRQSMALPPATTSRSAALSSASKANCRPAAARRSSRQLRRARDGLDADGQYYIGARAGFAVAPGIAGRRQGRLLALDTKSFTSAGSLDDLDNNATGLRFGGGLQVQLPGPLEGRLNTAGRNTTTSAAMSATTTDQVVAGLGLRF